MNNELKIYLSKWKIFRQIIFSLIFLFIGIICLQSDYILIEITGIGNLLIGFFIITTAIFTIINYKKPYLTLNDFGIKIPQINNEIIPWSSINNSKLINKNGNKLILEYKKDNISKHFKFLYRKIAKKNLNKGIIKLDLQNLEIDYNKLNNFLPLNNNY